MRRLSPVQILGGLVVVAGLAAAAWWLASPLFINKTVEEDFPFSANASIPDNMTQSEVEQVMSGMAKVDMEASEDMMDAMTEAVLLKTGSLRDVDAFHKGSGTLSVYELPDGSRVLRAENLNVTNGPDLHVLLSAHPNPSSQSELKDAGYVDLGSLKGNQGNQNYDIPENVDVTEMQSVVIYCMPFHVLFSIGTLQ